MHDVVVVGGGPAGCYTASLLSKNGFDVHVLEEHPVIGEPVDCSGVIGAEAFGTLGLPNSLKLGEINDLTLVSPSQMEVHFSPPTSLAYIVDRAVFDRTIAGKTEEAGGIFHFGLYASDLQVQDGYVEISLTETGDGKSSAAKARRTLKAAMVILAGGPRYGLQRKLGMGEPADFLRTAQTEVALRDFVGTRVLMGTQVAPGSFAWIAPFQRGNRQFARVGVSAKTNAVPYLKKLLHRLYTDGYLSSSESPMRSWVIPIGLLDRSFAERVLAVGDAAGQTKPTTGGGIFYALICAEAAARTAAAAFEKGNFSQAAMGKYEQEWRKKLGREIKIGAFFRRMVERLTDEEIDDLFRVVRSDGVLASVTSKARFDWHKDVIYFALRHPALGRIFLKGLFR